MVDASATTTAAQAEGSDQATPSGDTAALAARWIAEIQAAEKGRDPWLKTCEGITKRYTAEGRKDSTRRRYAMLWSNVQTLQPAVYARTPKAEVSRRFKDADPVGRYASEVLERACNLQLETGAFDMVMKASRDEFLLCALGQVWVRYVPTFGTAPPSDMGKTITEAKQALRPSETDNERADGLTASTAQSGTQVSDEPSEIVEWEEVAVDHVAYKDFLTNQARTWQEVRWAARRVFLARDELVDRFGEIGKAIPLEWKAPGADSDPTKADYLSKGIVWEVWSKADRTAYWVCTGYPDALLDSKPDPLKLRDFFPCPRPLLGTTGPESTIPTPDYIYYQDQAEEIDDLTDRIKALTKALKVVGVYAGEHKAELQDLLSKADGTLVPVDTYAALADKGGVKGIVDYFPVEMVAATLKALVEQRKQLIDDVYQITGISDIMRGDTDPNETKGAQVLKSNWGSSRVRDRQQEIARFARDIVRLQAEVIGQQFSGPTLAKMTNVQLPTAQEKAQVQAQYQAAVMAAQQPPAPPPNAPATNPQATPPGPPSPSQPPAAPAAQPSAGPAAPAPPAPSAPPPPPDILTLPTWEDVTSMLQDDALRTFRVDIEVDSTIEADEQQEMATTIQATEVFGKFVAESVPLVQTVPQIAPLVAEVAKNLARKMRAMRTLEDTIEKVFGQLEGMQPQNPDAGKGAQPQNPQLEAAKAQAAVTSAQASMTTAQARVADAQTAQFEAQSKHQIGLAQVAAEQERTHADMHMAAADNAHDAAQQAVQRAEEKTLQREMMPGALTPAGAR